MKLIINNCQRALQESPSHKNSFSDSFKAGVPTQAQIAAVNPKQQRLDNNKR